MKTETIKLKINDQEHLVSPDEAIALRNDILQKFYYINDGYEPVYYDLANMVEYRFIGFDKEVKGKKKLIEDYKNNEESKASSGQIADISFSFHDTNIDETKKGMFSLKTIYREELKILVGRDN
jgi:hypothetical protein